MNYIKTKYLHPDCHKGISGISLEWLRKLEVAGILQKEGNAPGKFELNQKTP